MAAVKPQVHIRAVEGRSLAKVQTFGKQDPYCVVKLGKQRFRSTTDDNGGTKPRWNEKFVLYVTNPHSDLIEIEVWDENTMADEFIGGTKVPVSSLLQGNLVDNWLPIYKQGGKSAGELNVRMQYLANAPAPGPAPQHGNPGAYPVGPGQPQHGYPGAQYPGQAQYPAAHGGAPAYPGAPGGAPAYPGAPAAAQAYPGAPGGAPAYPGAAPAYPGAPGGAPAAYPGAAPAYPGAPGGAPAGYPGAQASAYPGAPGGAPGYPGAPAGYPGSAAAAYPGAHAYPAAPGGAAYPPAPGHVQYQQPGYGQGHPGAYGSQYHQGGVMYASSPSKKDKKDKKHKKDKKDKKHKKEGMEAAAGAAAGILGGLALGEILFD